MFKREASPYALIYNLVFKVKSAHQIDALAFEPQTGSDSSASFELIKMMQMRDLITKDEYFNALKAFLQVPKVREDVEDIYAIIDAAKDEGRKDVIEAGETQGTLLFWSRYLLKCILHNIIKYDCRRNDRYKLLKTCLGIELPEISRKTKKSPQSRPKIESNQKRV